LFFCVFILLGCGQKQIEKEKPLLVFLHGYGDSKEHFNDLKKEFEGDFDILTLNGFFNLSDGNYSWGKVGYKEETNTWFDEKDGRYSTYKLRDYFKEERREIILIGVSQGATIGYSLAINYPKTFKSLVAINGYAQKGLMINVYHPKYSGSRILRINGKNDFLINQNMVKTTTKILDSLDIENKIIEHQEHHSYSEKEIAIVKDWIYNLNPN